MPKSLTEIKKQHLETMSFIFDEVSQCYPDFYGWFYTVFIDGLASHERRIIIETEGDDLTGLALLKKTEKNHAISTLFVVDKYRKKGVGSQIIDKAIEVLGGDKPISISVCEERERDFERLLESRGFRLKEIKIYPDENAKPQKEYFYIRECHAKDY